MRSIHEAATLAGFTQRIDDLRPDSKQQWGKMNVSQMLAHCANALEASIGKRDNKQGLLGKIFGKMAKKSVITDKPFKQNLPTAPGFKIVDAKEFNAEKQRLLTLLKKVSATNPVEFSKQTHPFFGQMTAEEWNILTVKHLDHHLRQFSV